MLRSQVFLPDGRGSLGHKGARAPGNSAGEGEPVSKVRGLRVPVSLVDAQAARVGDLADRVRQVRSLFFGRARGRPRGGVESVMASF